MPLTLYWFRFSPPARLARFAAEVSDPPGIVYEEVMLNQFQHLEEEFLKVNPKHQVPAMNENGTMHAESRHLVRHLFQTYCTNSTQSHWYPADPVKQKEVDARMDWSENLHLLVESGTIGYLVHQPGMGWRERMGVLGRLVLANAKRASVIAAVKKQIDEAEKIIEQRNLKQVTDLDFGDVTTYEEVLMVMEIHPKFTWSDYPSLSNLHNLMKMVPEYDVVHKPFNEFIEQWRILEKETTRPNVLLDIWLAVKTLAKAIPVHLRYLFGSRRSKTD